MDEMVTRSGLKWQGLIGMVPFRLDLFGKHKGDGGGDWGATNKLITNIDNLTKTAEAIFWGAKTTIYKANVVVAQVKDGCVAHMLSIKDVEHVMGNLQTIVAWLDNVMDNIQQSLDYLGKSVNMLSDPMIT